MYMENLSLRIAFDVINDKGEVVSSKKYPNGIVTPLAAEEITEQDYFIMEHKLLTKLSSMSIDKHLGHLFFQPPGTRQLGLSDITNCRGEERPSQYTLSRIELIKSHNNGQSSGQIEP